MKITIIEGTDDDVREALRLMYGGQPKPQLATVKQFRFEPDMELVKPWADGLLGRELVLARKEEGWHRCTTIDWTESRNDEGVILRCEHGAQTYRPYPAKVTTRTAG